MFYGGASKRLMDPYALVSYWESEGQHIPLPELELALTKDGEARYVKARELLSDLVGPAGTGVAADAPVSYVPQFDQIMNKLKLLKAVQEQE